MEILLYNIENKSNCIIIFTFSQIPSIFFKTSASTFGLMSESRALLSRGGMEAITQVPDLFGVAQLDVCPLLNKLGVSLQEVNAPARVFFQVIKLILKNKKKAPVLS